MSRARTRKQEEKVTFLQTNPEAVEQETVVTVEKSGGIFEAMVTGRAERVDYDDIEFATGKITLLSDLDTEDADFDARSDGNPVHPPGGSFGGGEDFISLSKDGIGIMGEDEFLGEDNGGYDVPREARAIDDGETLNFDVETFIKKAKKKGEDDDDEEADFLDYSEAPPGGIATNIEFKVLNNKAGTVELVLYGEDESTIAVKTVEIGAGQKGTMDMIGHVMTPNTTFSEWDFSVEGDVQVAITEIGYSTNYNPGDVIMDT